MNTPFDLKTGMDARIVYVRPVDVADLPAEVREESQGLETIYAVHAPDGERLALVANRRMAFALARENDFAPVTVH
ncbi:DUF1150 family protein [uncultured Litoreibacter sp.]|uniref:DUF1150 family protein n=1 Tax=uncultured Litoreibacter sp. TaxID=1392394 RepID=UPI00262D1129|nr:DUF1150 family protein [uncultured Litoreibacter sp.]